MYDLIYEMLELSKTQYIKQIKAENPGVLEGGTMK